MKINKKYESLIDEKVIEGILLVDGNSYSANINLINTLDSNNNYPVIINTDSKEIFNDNANSIEINCSNAKEELFIFVSILSKGFDKSFQIKGYLQKIISVSPNKIADNLIYSIPNSSAPPFVNFDVKWSNTIQLDKHDYKVGYHLSNDCIQVNLPKIKKADYLLLRGNIDKKIQYLTILLSFCRSTTVEWESCIENNADIEVGFRFIKTNTTKIFPNKLNPFRNHPELWINFIEHCVTNDMEIQSLIDTGIFQACGNLRWGCYLDEMTLIRHVAALEGVCRLRDNKGNLNLVVSDEKWKKFSNLRREPLKKAMQDAGFNDNEIAIIRKNIGENSRILNSLPIKEQIKQSFTQNELQNYYSSNKKSINSAFNVRNKIVHEGWNPKWENELSSYIFTTRNALFITILSILNYKGKLYLCGKEEPIDIMKFSDKYNTKEGI